MFQLSCHCGAVSLAVDGELTEVSACNCSICRRYGVLWAYFTLKQVKLTPPDGATDIYMWSDRSIEFHRCKVCGCVTHWSPVHTGRDRMGVNARLTPPELVAQAKLRSLDGAVTERYLDD